MSLDCEGNVGAVCDLDGCGVFDFLPWHCADCGGAYCSKHRLGVDHKCGDAADGNIKIATSADDEELPKVGGAGTTPNYITDTRKAVICTVCGNEDCLLHQLLPNLAEEVAKERKAALARRVWTGSAPPPSSGASVASAATTSSSAFLAGSGSSVLPWRIGKLSVKQQKENTTAAGSGGSAAAPTVGGDRFTAAAKLAGHTMNVVCVTVGSSNGNAEGPFASPAVLLKKVTFSHGVSVGYAADALASLAVAELKAMLAPPLLEGLSANRSDAQQEHATPTRRPTGGLFLLDHSFSSAATMHQTTPAAVGSNKDAVDTCVALRRVTGLDGSSQYLVDHLKISSSSPRSTSPSSLSSAAADGASPSVAAGPTPPAMMEKVLFAVIDPNTSTGNNSSSEEAILILQRLCRELMAGNSNAPKKLNASSSEASDDAASGHDRFVFPQFDAQNSAIKRLRVDDAASVSSAAPSTSASSLSERLLKQQIVAVLRLWAAQQKKRGCCCGGVVVGGDNNEQQLQDTNAGKDAPKPSGVMFGSDAAVVDPSATADPQPSSCPPALLPTFEGITFYNDCDGVPPSTTVFKASSSSSSSLADLPVAHGRATPLNAKDPLVAKMSPSSKALVGIQLLLLPPALRRGGSTNAPPSDALSCHHTLGKAFCLFVDGKWSMGRMMEKIKGVDVAGSCGVPSSALGSGANASAWQLVSVTLMAGTAAAAASKAAATTSGNCSLPTTTTGSGPAYALKVLTTDLSALGEAVGIANGTMLLLVEQQGGDGAPSPSSSSVALPASLLQALDGAFVNPLKVSPSAAPRRLQPKVEAKMRKDCVVQ